MPSWRSWHRPLLTVSALMAALTVISALGLALDDRVLTGSPVWSKPFKFSLSFTLYGLSLAWMLSLATRARRLGWWAGATVTVTMLIEMAVIIAQTVRGRRSHFNVETAFDATLYNVMGATVVVLWTASLVIALLLFRSDLPDRASAWALKLGSVIALTGAALGFLMTLPTPEQAAADRAGTATTLGAHAVGVPDGGPSMPLTGWSTTGGDLRIPHFIGMHALQLLPLLVLALLLLAPRLPRLRDERVRLRLVLTASAAYAALVTLVTWQALRGQPLTQPDGATLSALAAILAGTALSARLALRPARVPHKDPERELVS
ncbi:hypothetical protein [Streptomyces jumonjinensis]|uniref:hypothetical protein n=1 Tax=Streptomyces jumonjinensis TaxID=1945 RepID=UPI0037B11328